MSYVITKKCVGCLDKSCMDVCPCDCILGPVEGQMVIDPDPCIDCGACVAECPVDAIYFHTDAPAEDVAFNQRGATLLSLPRRV